MPPSARRCLTIGLAVIAALAATVASAAPAGQWEYQQFLPSGMFGFADQRGFRPPLAERDLRAIGETLELDETQREMLDDLLRSLVQEFKVEWVQHREQATDALPDNRFADPRHCRRSGAARCSQVRVASLIGGELERKALQAWLVACR